MMGIAEDIQKAYPQVSAPFAKEIVSVAERLGTHPYDLANLMNFESRLSPSIRNKISGATGLIQFMPLTAKGLGTTTDALARLDPVSQMRWVEKYFQPYKGKLGTIQGLYMAVFYPVAMTWSLDQEFPAAVRLSNPGISKVKDYIALATRNAQLPSSVDIDGSLLSTIALTPLALSHAAATAPWWVWGLALANTGVALYVVYSVKKRRRGVALIAEKG